MQLIEVLPPFELVVVIAGVMGMVAFYISPTVLPLY